ncbi:hypothetical protein PILCRDRAFT_150692 [Piloderma croceum F 1598]|uniref:Uncharacterized protein n=1 Tax=Piloderma croceum (strain F 1598) TaxID=765440 RepID=A0A0C3BWB0_PILCF|nr:hypothetical protein PILCRDRAFT_150692 [Piloderma croceum F 1598]
MVGSSSRPFALAQEPASWSLSDRWKKQTLSCALYDTLDRVNVLGEEYPGHTGCVNALSWAQDGEVLISGGDDTTVRVWRMDAGDTSTDYPFVCRSLIHTGHKANIFNAQMLPFSSRIATVAGDHQIRVFDIGDLGSLSVVGNETVYNTSESCIRVLRCHDARVKRIVTEQSPDLFLTVAEDGTVRQHDLRASQHTCSSGTCPPPLVKLPHELSTLALSPLTPYQFVVAGEAPYGYLFDRRQAKCTIQERWGMSPRSDDMTTCVRRFGRKSRAPGERRGREHITGARMPSSNGHEILLSYSSDAVYLYSTYDAPETDRVVRTPILSPNKQTDASKTPTPVAETESTTVIPSTDMELADEDMEHPPWIAADQLLGDDDASELSDADDEDEVSDPDNEIHSDVSVVLPRSRFTGHCNVATVKDVNFLGPNDEYVTSGSDDGNFFIWRKATGKLHGILEGDGSVVNVIEPHPRLPLIAVSGIDTTVKRQSLIVMFRRPGDPQEGWVAWTSLISFSTTLGPAEG